MNEVFFDFLTKVGLSQDLFASEHIDYADDWVCKVGQTQSHPASQLQSHPPLVAGDLGQITKFFSSPCNSQMKWLM